MSELLSHRNRLACYLLLKKGNKTLLLLRQNTGFQDGNYSLISGKVEAGESLLQSVIREAEEEAGILVDEQAIALVHTLHRKTADQQTNWIDFFFKASAWSGEIENKEPEKCGGLNWFESTSLPMNIVPYVEITLRNIQNGILYNEMHW